MDFADVIVEQIDEKATQLKEHLAEGKAANFEEYKRICGEIKGLLTARGYTLDLQRTMETSDE